MPSRSRRIQVAGDRKGGAQSPGWRGLTVRDKSGPPFATGLSVPTEQAKGEHLAPGRFQCIAHRGACGKTRCLPQNCRAKQNLQKGESRMRVLFSIHGSRGDVEPMMGLAVQLGAGECDAPAATGVMSIGVWR